MFMLCARNMLCWCGVNFRVLSMLDGIYNDIYVMIGVVKPIIDARLNDQLLQIGYLVMCVPICVWYMCWKC